MKPQQLDIDLFSHIPNITHDNIIKKLVFAGLINKTKSTMITEQTIKACEIVQRYESYCNNADLKVYICETILEYNILGLTAEKYGDLKMQITPENLVEKYGLKSIGGSMPDVSSILYVFVKT